MGRVQQREMERLFGLDEAVDAGGWPLFRCYWEEDGFIYHGDELVASHARPLTNPETFLSFARLAAHGEPSKDSILRWVQRHGLLEWPDPDSPPFYLADWITEQEPMSVVGFQEEARHAYKLLNLFELWRGKAVKDGKAVDELRHRTTLQEYDNPPELGGGRFATVLVDGEPSLLVLPDEVMTDDKILGHCHLAVKQAIEPYLQGMRLVFGSSSRLTLRCPDLLTAMYYQFAALVDGRRATAICAKCNRVFEQTRRNRNFCKDACRKAAKRDQENTDVHSSSEATWDSSALVVVRAVRHGTTHYAEGGMTSCGLTVFGDNWHTANMDVEVSCGNCRRVAVKGRLSTSPPNAP